MWGMCTSGDPGGGSSWLGPEPSLQPPSALLAVRFPLVSVQHRDALSKPAALSSQVLRNPGSSRARDSLQGVGESPPPLVWGLLAQMWSPHTTGQRDAAPGAGSRALLGSRAAVRAEAGPRPAASLLSWDVGSCPQTSRA